MRWFKFKISIRNRIQWSFMLLVSVFVVNGVITIFTLRFNNSLSGFVTRVTDPSIQALTDLNDAAREARMYTTNWVFFRSDADSKTALEKLRTNSYPYIRSRLVVLSDNWSDINYKDSVKNVLAGMDACLKSTEQITGTLKKFEDYNDPAIRFGAEQQLESVIIPRIIQLSKSLNTILSHEQEIRMSEEHIIKNTSMMLQFMIGAMAIIIIIIGIMLSFKLTHVILLPINKIHDIVDDLGKGITKTIANGARDDEIGEMVKSVNQLSVKLSTVASFANEVGNRNFDAAFHPLSNKDTLGKAIISMRDNLKKSEKELLEANYQMETFFRNIDKAFFSVDMRTMNLLQMSPACEKIFGYTALEMKLNKNLFEALVIEEDKEIIEQGFPKMQQGLPFTQEFRIRHRNNAVRWVESHITPTLDSKGIVIRIDGVASDITDKKEAEEKIKHIAELKKTNAELDRFVYSVSHDLRAPLSSMLGVIEIAEDDAENEIQKHQLQMLRGSVKKLDGFIQDILNYSRNARLDVKKEEIDFQEMLTDITNNLKYMSNDNQNNVEIRMHIHQPAPFLCDKSRVSIVLSNIISNAIRYQKASGEKPFVDIKVEASEDSSYIVIRDNGIGISKEHQKKIFDMFYRVSEVSVGSGLGLYIVKETIDKLDGKIDVDSEPGKGTAFSILLPNYYTKEPAVNESKYVI